MYPRLFPCLLYISFFVQAILEAANRCLAMRGDLGDEEREMIFAPVEPILQVHVGDVVFLMW